MASTERHDVGHERQYRCPDRDRPRHRRQNQEIDTGHATLAVAAGGDELMIAVGPTVDEAIAGLEGNVLTVATDGIPGGTPPRTLR